MNDAITQSLIPLLSGPVGVAIMVYLFKRKIERIDEIPKIEKDIQFIKEKLIEIKSEMTKMENHREDQILLKSEVKAQWRHIEELKNQVS